MFNKFALALTGLVLTVSSVGCCCLGGYGYGAGYGMRSCPPCNSCPPAGGTYYQPAQGAFYQGFDSTQTAYAGGLAPTQSAFIPSSTAMAPGAIMGQPIYSTAVVPASTLPLY